jgi:integrase
MERFERHSQRTFADAAARYLKEFSGKDKRRQAYALESLLPYIGRLRLMDVDDEAMELFKDDRRLGRPPFEKPAMCGTVNKELGLVTTILIRAARLWRWIPIAPKIEFVNGAQRYSWPLTWSEQDRLFRCLPTGWDLGAALFAVNSGVRKQELFGLKWADERKFTVPATETQPERESFVFMLHGENVKNGETRAVICNTIAKRAVEHQRKWQREKNCQTDFVFPSRAPGRMGSKVRSAAKVWQRAWKDAGLPMDPLVKKGIHNLRFTYATRLRAAGVSDEDRDALLGHSRTSVMSGHYGKADVIRLEGQSELVVERRDMLMLRGIDSVLMPQAPCAPSATDLGDSIGV